MIWILYSCSVIIVVFYILLYYDKIKYLITMGNESLSDSEYNLFLLILIITPIVNTLIAITLIIDYFNLTNKK